MSELTEEQKQLKERQAKEAEALKHIVVGGGPVDFTELSPLTLGDKVRLKKDYGIDFNKLRDLSPEEELKLVLFIVRKVKPDTKPEDIDSMPMVLGQLLMKHLIARSTEVDGPFSTRSTTSQTPTGGASAT